MKTAVQNQPAGPVRRQIAAPMGNWAWFPAPAFHPAFCADWPFRWGTPEAGLKPPGYWKQRVVLRLASAIQRLRAGLKSARRGKAGQPFDGPLKDLINTEFYLDAPSAKSVKLAADFTDWEKSPLDLIQSEEGLWFTIVPLFPGSYAYRFIVDGEWRDDPYPEQLVANPYGTMDAVINVT
jgi:hypothetical protein